MDNTGRGGERQNHNKFIRKTQKHGATDFRGKISKDGGTAILFEIQQDTTIREENSIN